MLKFKDYEAGLVNEDLDELLRGKTIHSVFSEDDQSWLVIHRDAKEDAYCVTIIATPCGNLDVRKIPLVEMIERLSFKIDRLRFMEEDKANKIKSMQAHINMLVKTIAIKDKDLKRLTGD